LSGKVGYLENGVDLDRFDPAESRFSPFGAYGQPIVFTGAMDYRPNIDAVLWFAAEIFPGIRHEHANAEFWIVGGNPSSTVRALSRKPGIFVTGAVPDVRPYLAHACCAVAPMRIARGVQNKVLEAMAMAKPVVLTPAALEGLHAAPDRDLLVASDPCAFARCVSEILSGCWYALGQEARACVEQKHRWAQNLSVLDDFLPEESCPAQCTRPETPSNTIGMTR
jgi:sugar transferase (PEP-CTERM/EpsH1 system associated)